MENNKNESVDENKTGAMSKISEALETMKGAHDLTEPPIGDSSLLGEVRIQYMKDAPAVGSVPPSKYTFLMDKLGERLAFERIGVRLYEALITKHQGSKEQNQIPVLFELEQFYMEELKHFNLLAESIIQLGGDPTLMTPRGDLVGVSSAGKTSIINDPRTTFLHCLEILEEVELVDNARWENLIELAEKAGLQKMAHEFTGALKEESEHLSRIRSWIKRTEERSQ